MQKIIIALVIFAAFVAVLSAFYLSGAAAGSANPGHAAQQQQQAASNKTAFATSQIAPYSYLVSNSTLSPQARAALAGYTLTRKPLQNGTVEMTISVTGSSANQTVMLPPGYRLYVVETSFGDDGYSYESSYSDDGFVLVDQNGYLV
ncbi:MAG: hypothetical protein KGH59_02390 [Candidatus Micrarchaeota archaeon]|nr:hypothetical protein [Candidatus Micrarchaeota archaeon]MDE1804606.1 hypothetical protein [Candidatus Micrarchaeota archaeon]MDE1846944.1 hypothetical protein [Candidatus Micrarchaeota archaeon]